MGSRKGKVTNVLKIVVLLRSTFPHSLVTIIWNLDMIYEVWSEEYKTIHQYNIMYTRKSSSQINNTMIPNKTPPHHLHIQHHVCSICHVPLHNQLPHFIAQQLSFPQNILRGRTTMSIRCHHLADNNRKIKCSVWHGQEGVVPYVLPPGTVFREGLGTAAEAVCTQWHQGRRCCSVC